jgi:Putative Flp pilus-assembly TadE/G-like
MRMARFCKSRRNSHRQGAILVWLALSLTVLIGILALTLDGGRLMEGRRHAQAAADAAALAAGADLYAHYWTNHGLDPSGTACTAAQNAAALNGFPASAVTVNVPPQSGTFAGVAGYAEVLLTGHVDATFSRIFSQSDLPVRTRTVARGQPMKLGMILLRPGGASAFLNNALAFTLVNAPLIVNSSDPAAFNQAGAGLIQAKRFDITGNLVNSGGAIMVGKVRTGVRPTPDPLALLPVPNSGLALVQSTKRLMINSVVPTILQPGVYQGGIQITGAAVVVMNPGIYIMEGGGFVVDQLATVVGLEVMIYNDISGYSADPVQVQSLGKVVLTAPLSGTYQGISLFQNRASNTPITVSGAGLTTMTGVIYAPAAAVSLTGSAAVGIDILGGAYVVSSATISGVGGINIDLGLNPPRIPDVRLVE